MFSLKNLTLFSFSYFLLNSGTYALTPHPDTIGGSGQIKAKLEAQVIALTTKLSDAAKINSDKLTVKELSQIKSKIEESLTFYTGRVVKPMPVPVPNPMPMPGPNPGPIPAPELGVCSIITHIGLNTLKYAVKNGKGNYSSYTTDFNQIARLKAKKISGGECKLEEHSKLKNCKIDTSRYYSSIFPGRSQEIYRVLVGEKKFSKTFVNESDAIDFMNKVEDAGECRTN
jgi:hypothetical protein